MENQPLVSQSDRIRYYLVCLLDILGQKEQLKKWAQLRPDGTITPEMREGLQNSLRRVLDLRKDFSELFKSAESGSQQSLLRQLIALNLQTGPERDRYTALFACNPKLLHFSDMLVAYSPAAAGPANDWNIVALYRMLGSLCSLIPSFLARGIPIRGGVCLGTAVEAEGVGFYGPALAEAHHLESKVAGYPRIVVSQRLADFIRSQPPENNDAADQHIRCGFTLCQSMIVDDSDGCTVVHYLGNGSRNLLAGSQTLVQVQSQAVAKAAEFVAGECGRLTLAAKAKPSEATVKLAKRYSDLHDYFQKYKAIWTG